MIRSALKTIRLPVLARSLTTTQTMFQNPKFFTKEHEWVQQISDTTFKVGITKHAADNLGEITYLGLEELQEIIDDNEEIEAGETLCEIESVKSAAAIGAPIAGTPSKINEGLGDEDGKLMNSDPENEGFLCEMQVSNLGDEQSLMNQEAYDAFLKEEK